MMTFVVLTSDDKSGVLYPTIVGPFRNEKQARKFARKLPNTDVFPDDHPNFPGAVVLHPFDGGYAGFVVVNAEHASRPEEYLAGLGYEDDDE